MLRLIVLLGLAAVCAAKYEHCCSAADRHIVQQQWNDIWQDVESAKLKIGFGRRTLLRLVEQHPELKETLKVVDIDHPESGRFSVYSLRILISFDNLILLLDDPEAFEAQLDWLSARWAVRQGQQGFTSAHFKDFGRILHTGLSKISEEYDGSAWRACFAGIFRKISARLPS